jgi:uncharacterized membrane protein (UPF0136 family)
MTGSSMLMTIGTVLDRAKEAGAHVSVSVNGSQFGFAGFVLTRDEQGLALDVAGDLVVVRLTEITAVRVNAAEIGLALTIEGDLTEAVA